MSRGIDQVEDIFLAIGMLVIKLNGVTLDRDASFALEVHVVEGLGYHVPSCNGLGDLQQTVGQGALAVIDMGYDAKVADILHKGCKDKE